MKALDALKHGVSKTLHELQTSENERSMDMAQLKAAAMRAASPVRSRVGNAVPLSKSKPKNRAKAKAARKARK